MPIGALREAAYGEAPHQPKATGAKSHGTHSTASAAGGGEALGHNPAHDIKHPNYCPNCGEALAHAPHQNAPSSHPIAHGPEGPSSIPAEASEVLPDAESAAEDSGESEMNGHPAFGSRKRTKGTKLKKGR